MILKVDEGRCIGCAACVGICPAQVIEMKGEFAVVGEGCVGCEVCTMACPVEAFVPNVPVAVATS